MKGFGLNLPHRFNQHKGTLVMPHQITKSDKRTRRPIKTIKSRFNILLRNERQTTRNKGVCCEVCSLKGESDHFLSRPLELFTTKIKVEGKVITKCKVVYFCGKEHWDKFELWVKNADIKVF
jgi:hypothetical protein